MKFFEIRKLRNKCTDQDSLRLDGENLYCNQIKFFLFPDNHFHTIWKIYKKDLSDNITQSKFYQMYFFRYRVYSI